jgi:hypothetical protein
MNEISSLETVPGIACSGAVLLILILVAWREIKHKSSSPKE